MKPEKTPPDDAESRIGYFQLSTDHLPPAQRLEFWYETTGRRMACRQSPDGVVSARLQGLVRNNIEFLDYAAESFMMTRNRQMCGRDGRDEISLGFVLSSKSGAVQNGREMLLNRGELYVIDFGKPVDSVCTSHHELALTLPRQLVKQVIGAHADRLGGQKLPTHGAGGLLTSHMMAIAKEAQYLTPAQEQVAMRAASDLALSALQALFPSNKKDFGRFSNGLYLAACRAIEQHCHDCFFNIDNLAALVGCSRATVYRLFRNHRRSVADAIWTARLASAAKMLKAPDCLYLSISEVARLCGFLDQSSFSKMFKRRFDMSPTDWRMSQIE